MNEADLLEFMRWIRDRGGECICTDWEMRVIKVIRGTQNEDKTVLFNVDGVLGAVNVSDNSAGKKTE